MVINNLTRHFKYSAPLIFTPISDSLHCYHLIARFHTQFVFMSLALTMLTSLSSLGSSTSISLCSSKVSAKGIGSNCKIFFRSACKYVSYSIALDLIAFDYMVLLISCLQTKYPTQPRRFWLGTDPQFVKALMGDGSSWFVPLAFLAFLLISHDIFSHKFLLGQLLVPTTVSELSMIIDPSQTRASTDCKVVGG